MYVLGLDLGTSSIKGLLMNEKGQVVATSSENYPLLTPQAGFSEQDPNEWVEKTCLVIEELKNKVKDFKDNLKGISFSGQMHSLVLLDEKGEVLRPAILWNDVRTTKQCADIMEKAGEKVLKITKNVALEGFTLPKILWVKENEPEIFAKVATFLLPKDYLGYFLTGNQQMEYSDGAGTLLLDVENKKWSEDLGKIFELSPSIFPPLVSATDFIGNVKKELAEKLGISPQVKVFAGGADNACAALGAGIISEDTAMASIGTSGVFLAFEGEKKPDYQGKLHYFNHVLKKQYYSMGVTLAAGQSLNYFRETFFPQEAFSTLLANIKNIPQGSEGLLFAPYIMGERTPYKDSQIRGSFLGIDTRHTKDHFLRSVLEGITYSLKDSQEIMKAQGKTFKKIISVGGGAKNPDWLQIQADVFKTDILTLEAEEGPGLGACMIASLGLNWFSNEKECVEKFVHYKEKIYSPIPKNVAIYEKYYRLYQKMYHATKEISWELQQLN